MKKKFGDFGDFDIKKDQVDMIEGVTKQFEDKTDDEIFVEIINLNEQMEKDLSFEEYEAIFEQLDAIRHLLSDDQLEKLDKILKHLGR
ncbi:MAG: hypothetical protein RIN55_07460 [Tissierellaceae bacterium]|nr:hypothetical protein [Tissierellaceae bacterium]